MTAVFEESFGVVPLSKKTGTWKIFIILHKSGNHWGFPKGHGNPDESPLQAATRELQEETGLEVDQLIRESPFIEEYQFRKKGQFVSKRVYYFPALVKGRENLQAEEVREGKWVTLSEAQNILTFKEARGICHEIQKILS